MVDEPIYVTLRVVDALDKLSISYFIGGSLASALYGVARSTIDADLIAEIHSEHAKPLVQLVDIFALKQRPFDRNQMKRKVLRKVTHDLSRQAYTTTAEDIILAKLEWYRLGGEVSDRQWRDVLGVLKVQAGLLEMDYMVRWAGELGVGDLLERALQEAG